MSAFSFASVIELDFRGNQKAISLSHKPFLIAEFGLNHNKDIELVKKMVLAAAQSGADAIKLQSYTTDQFINPKISQVSELADIFRQFELSYAFHEQVATITADAGLIFFSTPLTPSWPAQLKKIGAPLLKIASGDLNNWQLLEAARKTNLPLIISTGAALFQEVEKSAAWCALHGLSQTVFLHCVSLYPTPIEKANIGRMAFMSQSLGCLAGFSDHTQGNQAAFAAVAAGGVVIEKHFTLDRSLSGPDQLLSATPDDLSQLRQQIDLAFEIRGQQGADSFAEEFKSDYYGKRAIYETNLGLMAMRPREQSHPPASSWFNRD